MKILLMGLSEDQPAEEISAEIHLENRQQNLKHREKTAKTESELN